MNSKDIKMISEQYSSMCNEGVEHEEVTEDGYKVQIDVEYQDDNTIEYISITPPEEDQAHMIQGRGVKDIEYALDYHRQHGKFPNQ